MRLATVVLCLLVATTINAQFSGIIGAVKGITALSGAIAKLVGTVLPSGLLLPFAAVGPLKLSLPMLLALKGLGFLKFKLMLAKIPLLAPVGAASAKFALLRAKYRLGKTAAVAAGKGTFGIMQLPVKLTAMKMGAIAGANAGAKAGLAKYKMHEKASVLPPMALPTATHLFSQSKGLLSKIPMKAVTVSFKNAPVVINYIAEPGPEPEVPAYGYKPTTTPRPVPAYTPAPPAYTLAPPAYTRAPPAYTPAPEPTAHEQEPATYEPEPATYEPEPAAYEPEPAAFEPELAAYESEPAPYAPEPAPYAPEPTAHAPEPATYESEPAAYAPEPAANAPEPTAHEPEPATYEPEPAAYAPEPTAHEPEPTAYEPEPAAYAPEPTAHEPEPTAYEPVLAEPSYSQRRRREAADDDMLEPAALREIFQYILTFDEDRCVQRLVCELAVDPKLAGKGFDDVPSFIEELDESDPTAPWMAYKEALQVGKNSTSSEPCYVRFAQCERPTETLIETATQRLSGADI